MNLGRRKLVEEVFRQVAALPMVERQIYLEQVCNKHPGLQSEVENLLAAHDETELMEASAALASSQIARDGVFSPREQDQIGNYRLLRKIGEGGMSEVYLAVRADDEYRKRVALKVVRRGYEQEDLIRRFRIERQILAGFDHPNIATFFDGGSTEQGLLYFVMEYIEGVAVDEYCNRNQMTVVQRLELFRTICGAVQYAHQNLVVHRDIKPHNILVTTDGVVKLLDFGIAKLLNPDHFAEPVEYTAAWQRPMTTSYASPEQVQGTLVGTPSDVYSLGVLLYKLLTGQLPHRMAECSPNELASLVVEKEPDLPSKTITTDPEASSRVRSCHPDQLRRQLSGDLDNIVLKALRKEPHRRYGSADQFSEDIRRYLKQLPVNARRGTLSYRAGKFLRRNRVPLVVASAFVFLLIGYAITIAVQTSRIAHERDQARRERDRAEQVMTVLEEIFKVSDPHEAGENISAKEILERGTDRVIHELEGQPELQGTLMTAIGNVYRNLGLLDKSRHLLEIGLVARREVLGDDHPDVEQSLHSLGRLLRQSGEYTDAEPLLRDTLNRRIARYGRRHPLVAESSHELARLLQEIGEYKEAEMLFRKAIRVHEETEGRNRAITYMLTDLAILLSEMGSFTQAEALFRESLDLRREILGNDHLLVGVGLNDLGVFLGMQGKLERAEPLLREALVIRRKVLGENHPQVAENLNNLARLLKEKGAYDESAAFYREALEIEKFRLGDTHPRVGIIAKNLARLLHNKGDLDEAEQLYLWSLKVLREALGEGHSNVGATLSALGKFLVDDGRAIEGERELRKALGIFRKSLPDDHWLIGETRSYLGECLLAQGKVEEAEIHLVAGYESLRDTRGDRHARTLAALQRLVGFYEAIENERAAASYRAMVFQ